MNNTSYIQQQDTARDINTKVATHVTKMVNKLQREAGIDNLRVAVSVFVESRFAFWATQLAKMLCRDTSLALKSNKELAALITDENGETGFDASIMSKKLSDKQVKYAADVLRSFGYTTDLVKGTDIKRIVKNNLRLDANIINGVEFFADGLSIDSRFHRYHLRDSAQTGKPWSDFTISVCGEATRLTVLMKLRNIGVSKFIDADERAVKSATVEVLERRNKMFREWNPVKAAEELAATENEMKWLRKEYAALSKGFEAGETEIERLSVFKTHKATCGFEKQETEIERL